MEKRATIKDVARLAGVSISTASLAINGKEGGYRQDQEDGIGCSRGAIIPAQ